MTVAELMAKLEEIPNKDAEVYVLGRDACHDLVGNVKFREDSQEVDIEAD